MELKPASPTAIRRPEPLPLDRGADPRSLKRAATGFEGLLLARMLATASRPSPFAGPLAAGSTEIRSETNRLLGQRLAEAAPLGLETLLTREARARKASQ